MKVETGGGADSRAALCERPRGRSMIRSSALGCQPDVRCRTRSRFSKAGGQRSRGYNSRVKSDRRPARGNLSDRVARYLVDHIRKKRLSSGAEIPSEIRLSAELQVSRGIVREAYRALETAGVLEIANGRSPRVGRLSNQTFAQFLQHALSTAQASPEHVFDLRSSIEIRAAELAAENRTNADAEALHAHAAAMRASWRRRERFVDADMQFHEVLGRATRNPLFALLASALREALELTIRAGFDSRHSREELLRVAEIHGELAAAIAAKEPARARRLMTVHFEEAREYVLGWLVTPQPIRRRATTRRRRAAAPTSPES
jgi:DNA-binding FadR family transcriptional regulator